MLVNCIAKPFNPGPASINPADVDGLIEAYEAKARRDAAVPKAFTKNLDSEGKFRVEFGVSLLTVYYGELLKGESSRDKELMSAVTDKFIDLFLERDDLSGKATGIFDRGMRKEIREVKSKASIPIFGGFRASSIHYKAADMSRAKDYATSELLVALHQAVLNKMQISADLNSPGLPSIPLNIAPSMLV